MNTNKKVCAAAAGFVAAWLTAAPASAQNFLQHELEVTAGSASQVSIANLKPGWVVTGITSAAVGAQVTTWEFTEKGMAQKGSATTSYCCGFQEVSTVALSSSHVLTIGTNFGNPMLLTSWSVSSSGAVTVGSTIEGEVVDGLLAAAKLDAGHVVLAFTNAANLLQLDVFSVASNGSITEDTSTTLDTIAGGFGIAALSSSQAVTATCGSPCGESTLQLDSWKVSPHAITHQKTYSVGTFPTISITAWGEAGHVATAVLNVSGETEVSDWTVDASTGAFALQSTAVQPGLDSDGAVISTIGNDIFTLSIAPGQQQWNAGEWEYDPSFMEAASAAGDGLLSGTSYPAAAPLSSESYSVTAIVNNAGNLQLDIWYYFSI